MTDAEVAGLFRHILAESLCNMDDEEGGIVLMDTSWVDVTDGQFVLWRALLSEIS